MLSSNSIEEYNEVAQAEYAMAEAHLNLDIAVIDNLLHSDCTIVQPGGKVESKADVLASYQSNTRHWSFAWPIQMAAKFRSTTL